MNPLAKLTLLILVLFLAAPIASSQQTDSTSLARLRIEIRKLENAARNAPFELREINDGFLRSRRDHLKTLLRQRMETLEKYAATVRSMLNEQERKDLESAIEEIRIELDDGNGQIAGDVTPRSDRAAPGSGASSDVATRDDAHANARLGNTGGERTPEPAAVEAPPAPVDAEEDEPGPFSGTNARMIIGFEQSGAASAASVQKPFIDFFINTPIPFGKNRNSEEVLWPRFSVWGDIRLASTPQQITAFGAAVASPVASFTGEQQNELVTGFDFSVGPELRIVRAGRTHLSLIAGFGAISPLSYRQSAPIFKVPATTNPQYERFIADFPGAKGKDFIAFVPPDRDRFLRHYFGGFRFRTYQYEKDADYETDAPLNRFPAMLDVTFGQSEAVTGGRLKKFVVNLDGFYPLPWPRDSSLLYLFGTAKIIAGGRKTIKTPFILDTAESSIQLTNDKVFITDQTSNRDYYRLGFGVDLIELFKFAKKSGKEQPAAAAPAPGP